jgi:hypothetical protein
VPLDASRLVSWENRLSPASLETISVECYDKTSPAKRVAACIATMRRELPTPVKVRSTRIAAITLGTPHGHEP